MAIKFLSGLNLSNVTAGSILKLDSNGNIVAATAGTDYVASSLWTASGSNIYYSSGNVTIGASSNSAPLHVYAYQTTDPKILIEDGNTGDASMQFKISTQQYTMGIDNSDSDIFKISAGNSFTTSDFEMDSSGKVGIKTTPSYTLDVYSGTTNVVSRFKSGDNQAWISIQDDDSGTYGVLLGTDSDNSQTFIVADSNANKKIVLSGDKLGVLTDDPDAHLHVVSTGDNGSAGLSDYGFVVTSTSTDQPTLGAESTGDGYANLNLGSNISGTRRFWHISKRKSTDSHKLSFYYYNGSGFDEKFEFRTDGSFFADHLDLPSGGQLDWANGDARIIEGDVSNYSLSFQTYTGSALTTKMFISSGGNVGINTTAPEGTLDVVGSTINGTAQADWSNDGVSYNTYGDLTVSRRHGATKDSDWGFTGPLIDLRSSNAGSEWSVAQILGTVDPLGGSNHQGGLAFLTSGGGTTNPTGRRDKGAAPQVRMLIGADGTTYMQGNVGIGTTSPVQKLQVDGSIYSNGGEIFVNGNKGLTAVGNLIFKAYDGSNYFEGMRLTSAGNVGIGTNSPTTNLHVNGAGGSGVVTQIKVSQADDGAGHPGADAILQSSGWGEAFLKLGSHYISAAGGDMNIVSSSDLNIQTGGTNTRMFIKSSGAVGIDTTTPNHQLDVAGVIMGRSGISTYGYHRTVPVYSYNNGILIATNIATSDNNMIQLEVTGNTYSNGTPLKAQYQCYNYTSTGTIIRYYGISTHPELEVDVFHYNGYVYFWMEQVSSYNTLTFELYSGLYSDRRITQTSNSAKPTTGVTNSVTIVPKSWWHSGNDGTGSGLDADTVDGLESTSFARSDADDTLSGSYTFSRTSTAPALKVSGHAGANSYNYILNGSNDGGTKAVHFVNGSTRTADGGANAYTIRNDGGNLVLGSNSYDTNIYGHGVNINAQTDELSLQIAGTERLRVDTDGSIKLSAYGAGILKTSATGIVSVDTSTYVTDVDWSDINSINGTININSTTQIGQGDTETLVSFQNSGTERGRFEVDDSANSYFVATGFKTTGSSTGLLKSDGTIDTSTYATTADINSFIEITDVATYLSTNNYITSSYTGFDSRYYTETEANDRFVSYENYNRAVPAAGGWYKLVKLSRGAVRIGISYTGGNMSPHTYIVEAFKDWSSTGTLNVQKYGESSYISEFRIIKESGGGNSDYYLEAYFTSLTNAHSFECYFQEILGYRSVSEIFAVSSGNTLNATNSGTNTPIEALVVGSNEGLYTRNLDVNGRLYLDTLDTNTTSTSALVVGSSSEIEKRTLGSNAFTSTDFVASAGDTMTGNLSFNDNSKVILGGGSDFEMFHNGSNTFLQTTTGSVGDLYITARGTNHDLYLEAADDIFIRPQGNESGIDVIGNGAVKLYYDGAMKLETTSDGINVPGVSQLGATCFYFHDVGVGDADGLDVKWTLKDKDGNDVTSTSTGVVYRLRLVTLGTGTNTGAVYICDNVDGAGWRTKKVASVDGGAPNSNFPFVEIDGGVPKVTIEHNSTYNVRVFVEAFIGGNGGASYTMLGLDSGITNENGSVLMSLSSSTTEATSVMIGADNILRKRELGSLAFNSTTLGTAASAATTDFLSSSGGTVSGTMTISSNSGVLLNVTGANSSYTAVAIKNTGSGNAGIYYDAMNGDLSGSDYGFIGQDNTGHMLYNVGTSSPAPYHVFTGGDMGIGTSSPTARLDIRGGNTTEPTLRLESSSGAAVYGLITGTDAYHGLILRGVPSGATTYGVTYGDQMSFFEYGGQFRFYEKNNLNSGTLNEIARIDKSTSFFNSNVGIGTTNPGFKLEVNGTTRLGDTATEYTRFGTYGALLSTDTHILHNMLWTGSWTQIDNTKSSSTIYMGSSSSNTIKFGYTGAGDTSWSYNHTFENDGDYTAAGVIKGYGSVRVDAAATGSPYFGLYQAGSEKAYIQYVDSTPADNLLMQSDGKVTIRGDVQYDQGDEYGVISFNQSTAELAKIDQDGYMYAAGFKTTTASTGFLKADGTVDTNTYANSANVLALSGGTMTGDLTIPSKIIHSGDTNTFFQFNTDEILFSTGGGSTFKVNTTNVFAYKDLIVAGGETISLGERAEGDDNGRTVLIEGVAGLTNGEGSGRIFFSEHNSTSAAADSYGLSLYYEGNGNAVLPSGFNPNTGNATWSLRRHDNSVNGTPIFFGSRSNSNVTFEGTLSVPEYIYHRGDANTYIRLLTDRIQIVAGGTAKFDSNNTYLVSGAAITVKGITARDIVSESDRTYSLGTDANRWAVVFCETLDSAGQHESKLQNPEGETPISEYETGTVLVWKGGKNVPCTTAVDHMRMGIAVKGVDSPLVQGAEPVLCTGDVKEGDYLVTSTTEGHAEAISPEYMRQHMLFDCVIGKALENGAGESHLVKTWINI